MGDDRRGDGNAEWRLDVERRGVEKLGCGRRRRDGIVLDGIALVRYAERWHWTGQIGHGPLGGGVETH